MNRTVKERQDEKAKELWVGIEPTAEKCKTCLMAYSEDEHWGGYLNSNCEIFEPPECKPKEVLWDGADCEYYAEDF